MAAPTQALDTHPYPAWPWLRLHTCAVTGGLYRLDKLPDVTVVHGGASVRLTAPAPVPLRPTGGLHLAFWGPGLTCLRLIVPTNGGLVLGLGPYLSRPLARWPVLDCSLPASVLLTRIAALQEAANLTRLGALGGGADVYAAWVRRELLRLVHEVIDRVCGDSEHPPHRLLADALFDSPHVCDLHARLSAYPDQPTETGVGSILRCWAMRSIQRTLPREPAPLPPSP